MLACKHCSTPNSLDSTFCKKCGTAVPADQRREASLQLDKLVDEGLVALNAGRTAEALAIADSAVASDPSHLGALHLKSAVHERRGEIADALESAERIVELNPDSELDRIKRNGLRSSLLNASTPVRPDRRIALLAAGATMVLVACSAILLARRGSATPETTVATNTNPVVPSVGTMVENPVAVDPHPATQAPNQSTPEGPGVPNVQNNGLTNPGANRQDEPRVPVDRRIVPIPTTNENEGLGGLIDPGPPPQEATTQTTPKPVVTPPVVKNPGNIDPDPGTLTKEPPKDDGSIQIEVSRSSRTGGSKMIPETRTNGSTVYAQVGTERFQLGDYNGAAVNLEKAVAGGGDAVQLNLRLAQAYSRLGRNSEAASAYERSRTAANAALASGKGDKERLQAARDAAEAGLKTVKGG